MTRLNHLAAMFILTFSLAPAAQADELKEVEKKIAAAAEKIKSMTADLTMEMNMSNQQQNMKMSGKGTVEFLRKEDKYLSRHEMKMTMDMGGGMPSMEQKSLSVTDGEYTYTMSEQMGQKTAFKNQIDPKNQSVPSEQMFDMMRKMYTLKLLPSETVNGHKTYAIEATPKTGASQFGKSVFYFDQEKGVMVKMVTYGADGDKPMQTVKVTNIKTGVDIPAEHFVFKAPPGVQVKDMTSGS